MSSQPFVASSPTTPSRSSRRRKSRFTYKNLSQLGVYSPTCPLRVIAHLDLDCFYAQCEMVRLGVPDDQPLAVQQWQALIAINYAAREFGLSRMVTISEAKKACPEIIIQHVATWREGDEKWAYHEDAFKNMGTHKASLDPYRLESRKILATIKELLPAAPLQRVEKASIDEVFLDLSAHVHAQLLDRYPQLAGPPPYDDPTEQLPAPQSSALDWNADALVDLDADQNEEDDPDWDDVAMLIGSEIIRSLRAGITQRLKYTLSAGLARNKMLAKLGSGHKKPNQQTIIRNRAVQHFLDGFKFTKIRMLGGKLGDEVVSAFNTDSVKELLQVPIEQLKAKFGDDTGSWLHGVIRGEDLSEVKTRTQLKSMLSAKSFQPSINSFEQAIRWLRIFVADIYARLVEEGVTENKRRPKTINLHHRQGAQTRSKQTPIPMGKMIDEHMLFDLAKTLLAQVIVDGRAWPCSNLSLTVGGFEDGITGNKGIGSFLVRGDEAKALYSSNSGAPSLDFNPTEAHTPPPSKRRRLDEGKPINQFFTRRDENDDHIQKSVEFEDVPSAQGDADAALAAVSEPFNNDSRIDDVHDDDDDDDEDETGMETNDTRIPSMNEHDANENNSRASEAEADQHRRRNNTFRDDRPSTEWQQTIPTFFCSRCSKTLLADQQAEHEDFHFAQDLQNQDHDAQQQTHSHQQAAASNSRSGSAASSKKPAARRKPKAAVEKGSHRSPAGGGKAVEKGQKTLHFTT